MRALSRHILQVARRGLAHRLHRRAAPDRRSGQDREGAPQQRQRVARTGGSRRDDARRRLSRPSHSPAQPLRREPRRADRIAAPPFRRGRGQRRRGGAACVLAIAGGRARRRRAGGASAPRPRRRLFAGFGRRVRSPPVATRPAQPDPRLRVDDAAARSSRASRACRMRSTRRSTCARSTSTSWSPGRLLPITRRRRARAIWPQNFADDRLYATARVLVQARRRFTHERPAI